MNFKMTISYIGTNYNGWQSQPNKNTIQDIIEDLLFKIFNSSIKLRYTSRTDSGVHAIAQVASFQIETKYTAHQIQMMLNTQLPEDIVITDLKEEKESFDARKSLKKTYYYLIYNSKVKNPFLLNRAWHIAYNIDMDILNKSLNLLLGKKDFSSFMGAGSSVSTTIREVYSAKAIKDGDLIKISITANGFLKHMIRNIVGTVVEVSKGKISLNEFSDIIESCDRNKAGITAPPYGLYLEKIYYE